MDLVSFQPNNFGVIDVVSPREATLRKSPDNLATVTFVTGSCKNPDHCSRLFRHCPIPRSEPAVLVHGLDPRIQKRALGFVLVAVLAFGFEHQKVFHEMGS
jgi:hypothetical protein